jgi:PAS domain S-box-containing protein
MSGSPVCVDNRDVYVRFDALRRLAGRLRGRELAVPLVVLLLAAPVAMMIRQFDGRVDRATTADHLVRTLGLEIADFRALEWRTQVPGQTVPTIAPSAEALNARLDRTVRGLAASGEADGVVAPARAYRSALVDLVAVARTRDRVLERRLYLRRVAPAEARLRRALAAATGSADRAAANAQEIAVGGSVLLLAAAAGIALLMGMRVNRLRAAKVRAGEAAQRQLEAKNVVLADTERLVRHAEHRYRTLVEQLPGVAYMSALDGSGTIFVAPQMEALLGYPVDEWASDHDMFLKRIHPDDRERVRAEGAAMRAGTAPQTFEYRMVRRDGSELWVHDDASIVNDEAGRPSHVQGYLRDVTLLHEAREQREALLEQERAANDRLRQLDAMKDELVALVSHELRTPLTSIAGYVELLLDGDGGPLSIEQSRYLAIVERNARRLERLVGDLLFMARYQAGRFEIERAPVDLAELARDCVETALPAARANDVELVCHADGEIVIQADHVRIAELLDNLVSNALKFTPVGGRIDVDVRDDGATVVLDVTDTGMGIPPELQERLFERFFRTPEAAKQAIQGTGLGLAISRAIVEAHGGAIAVTSSEGRGTTFRVTLPRTPVPAFSGAVDYEDGASYESYAAASTSPASSARR